ncbi:Uncharacterized protein DBV15_08193 [Temnothorax longispinosus]|uniref:Uncharacterized protein n=1 Tax=Temnothorax longispinosus TaxID=300112 RepID=A0A4S2KW39_9HYME|nr:Uncharacterized protein DBV15_08193 [Temnothorax longispinosus]
MGHVTQFHEEWNCARASNVAAKRILRERCRSQAVEAKESFLVRNIALGKRRKRETRRESAKFSDVATTTASFVNAEDLKPLLLKDESASSRIAHTGLDMGLIYSDQDRVLFENAGIKRDPKNMRKATSVIINPRVTSRNLCIV